MKNLLAIDRDANLVVVELKRDSSTHMELQALRYAAMVAPLSFAQVVDTYSRFLRKEGSSEDARELLEGFLNIEDQDEPTVTDVRVVLVCGSFSKELTTAVLWLNKHDLDIRCVQLELYRIDESLIADIRQIVPIPGTEDYQVSLRDKHKERRRAARRNGTMEDFWAALPEACRPVCESLEAWLTQHTTNIWVGKGSFLPIVRNGGQKHHFARFRSDGEIAILFDLMARKPPFEDPVLRAELMNRLNAIPGIEHFRVEKLARRPRFEMRVLEDRAAMEAFQEVALWWNRPGLRDSHGQLATTDSHKSEK